MSHFENEFMRRDSFRNFNESLWNRYVLRFCSRTNKEAFGKASQVGKAKLLEDGVQRQLKQLTVLDNGTLTLFIEYMLDHVYKHEHPMVCSFAIALAEKLFQTKKYLFNQTRYLYAVIGAASRDAIDVYDMLVRTHGLLPKNDMRNVVSVSRFLFKHRRLSRELYQPNLQRFFAEACLQKDKELIDMILEDDEVISDPQSYMDLAVTNVSEYAMKKLYELGQSGVLSRTVYVEFGRVHSDFFAAEFSYPTLEMFIEEAFKCIKPGNEDEVKHNIFLCLPYRTVYSMREEWKKLGVDVQCRNNALLFRHFSPSNQQYLHQAIEIGLDINAREGSLMNDALLESKKAVYILIEMGAKFYPKHLRNLFIFLRSIAYYYSETVCANVFQQLEPYFTFKRDLPSDAIRHAADSCCLPLFIDVLEHLNPTNEDVEYAEKLLNDNHIEARRDVYEKMIQAMKTKIEERRRMNAKPAYVKRDREADEETF